LAIGPPDRTIIQIWTARFWNIVFMLVSTMAYLIFFGRVMVPNREIGIAISPIIAILYWRLISKLSTGEQFSLQIKLSPSDLQEVYNVLFTVLYSINLIVFGYHLLTWYQKQKGI
jgi:hypothetical protein